MKQNTPLTSDEISILASLPEEELLELSGKLSISQKQDIYQSLCAPKTPKWIQQTVEIHSTASNLKSVLPKVDSKKSFLRVIEMIMISSGDFIPPNKETVKALHSMIKSFIQDQNKLSKKKLENTFSEFLKKYKTNNRVIAKFDESDQESQNLDDNSGGGEMKNVERLQFNDARTSGMTDEQYFYFTECRKASFLKYGKERFMKWGKLKHSPKLYGWIAREKIFQIIEYANRRRNSELKLQILDSPIGVQELVCI